MKRLTPVERERRIAELRRIQRDPNTAPLFRLAALQELNKLMGLSPQ